MLFFFVADHCSYNGFHMTSDFLEILIFVMFLVKIRIVFFQIFLIQFHPVHGIEYCSGNSTLQKMIGRFYCENPFFQPLLYNLLVDFYVIDFRILKKTLDIFVLTNNLLRVNQ